MSGPVHGKVKDKLSVFSHLKLDLQRLFIRGLEYCHRWWVLNIWCLSMFVRNSKEDKYVYEVLVLVN